MPTVAVKKNKICLTDYNYRRDIENRLLMAEFTTFDVDILHEILNNSLKISIKTLADTLAVTVKKITPTLDKLSQTKLFKNDGDFILVDKEMRKYYEFQLRKFDDNFEPSIEFFQNLLSQIPIHVLPNWYSISRTSDNIFSSIIEKYLLTPKIYEKHIAELAAEDPILNLIKEEVFTAPNFKVSAKSLLNKLKISREKFEELLLNLEYNLVCTLSYSCIGDRWQEVITPFHEWREYLTFQRDSTLIEITDEQQIVHKKNEPFAFLKDMAVILDLAKKGPITLENEADYTLSSTIVKGLISSASKESLVYYKPYYAKVISKIIMLELAEICNSQLKICEDAQQWMKKSYEDQALQLFRLPLKTKNAQEKSVREIEKSLKRIIGKGWIDFASFVKGLTAPIGNTEPVTLKCKGKRWKYALPEYSPDDFVLIEMTILERLFEAGMVATGMVKGKPCFCVTYFGKLSIGD